MRGLPLAVALLWPVCALAAAPNVTASPTAVLLGTDAQVEITVAGDGAALRGFAAIGALVRDGEQQDETQVYRWIPPDIRYPTTAVLLFWTRADSARDIAVLRISLVGRTDLKISTEPRATVRVQVQERMFGPVAADAKGRASVPIEVPPEVRRARVLVDAGGTKSTREAPIDVPATNPLAAVFATESFAIDELGTLIIANARGSSSDAKVSVSGGAATERSSNADVTLYSVKAEPNRGSLGASASLGDFKVEAKSAIRAAGTSLPPPEVGSRLLPHLGVGGFFAGGSSYGSAIVAGIGWELSSSRLTLEFEAGFRGAGLSAEVPGLGRIDSRVVGVPLTLGARYRLLRLHSMRLDVRGGVGALLFNHTISAVYQRGLSEFGVRPEFFAGLVASWRLGPLEPFGELRAEWNQIRTPTLFIRPGGVVLLLGTRLSWR